MFLARSRKHSPPAVVGMLLVSSLVVRCASKDAPGERVARTDAAVTGEGGRSLIQTGSGGKGTGGQIFFQTGGSDSIGPTGPIDSGPYYSCTSASVEKDCAPPASTCDGATLAFFTDSKCIDGQCQWTRQTRACAGACADGGCAPLGDASNGQADASPPCGSTIAGDASGPRTVACAIPPSVCLGRSQLLYFVNPTCVDGSCRTTAMLRYCGTCVDGGCQRNFTL
jgi:hypothetical protein